MMSLQQFKAAAFDKFKVGDGKAIFTLYRDPISFLYAQDWVTPEGEPFSDAEMDKMNISFDERGCFGRAVKAAVLAEQHFPSVELYAGEVCEDLFRLLLLDQATPESWEDETYIAEILQYENPHLAILTADGKQFDPIFNAISQTPSELKHPKVKQLPLWECLYSSYLISAANIARITDLAAYSELLDAACAACPEMILHQENFISKYAGMGHWGEAIRYATLVAEQRKDARTLWALWAMTGDESYAQRIRSEYHPNMLVYLNKTLTP